MASEIRMRRAEPVPGAYVLGVTNRKGPIGRMSLERQAPMTREIIEALRDRGLRDVGLAGASGLGTAIPVPDEYMRTRTVSSVVDVFVDGSRGLVKDCAKDMGFRRAPIEDIFSVTYENGDGVKRTAPTVAGQMRFNGNPRMAGLELIVTFVPAEWVRVRQGRHAGPTVEIWRYERVPTPGRTLLEKLIRGTSKDVADVAAAAAAADLGRIVNGDDIASFIESVESRAGRSGWLADLIGRIEQVDRSSVWYVGEYGRAVPQGSVDLLATLKRMAESLHRKQ